MASAQHRLELLDDEGDLTEKFNQVLAEIFHRFSSEAKSKWNVKEGEKIQVGKQVGVILTEDELDNFAKTVNEKGNTLTKEEKDELREYFEVDKDGNLTFNGFCEMYHLQTSGQTDETWKDLLALGYDDQLELEQMKKSQEDDEK